MPCASTTRGSPTWPRNAPASPNRIRSRKPPFATSRSWEAGRERQPGGEGPVGAEGEREGALPYPADEIGRRAVAVRGLADELPADGVDAVGDPDRALELVRGAPIPQGRDVPGGGAAGRL